MPSTSVIVLFAADERVIRRVPAKAETRDMDRGLSREGPGVPAREIIFAESPVLCVYHRALDSCGRRIPYPILRSSLRHQERDAHPPNELTFSSPFGLDTAWDKVCKELDEPCNSRYFYLQMIYFAARPAGFEPAAGGL